MDVYMLIYVDVYFKHWDKESFAIDCKHSAAAPVPNMQNFKIGRNDLCQIDKHVQVTSSLAFWAQHRFFFEACAVIKSRLVLEQSLCEVNCPP